MDSENRRLVNDNSPAQMSRALIALLNQYTEKPETVNMEYLTEDSGLALSVIQTPYIIRRYITGGYVAQYDCEIIYRTMPANDAQRLEADETLDSMVTWLVQHIGELDLDNIRIKRIDRQSLAALTARYENCAEDHTSTLSLQYEVI